MHVPHLATIPRPHRTADPAFLNMVANDPRVRPHLGGGGELDFTRVLSDPNNIGFVGASGGFVVEKLSDCGLYEGHSMFLPDGSERASDVLDALLHYLFVETDCAELLTKIPAYNKGAIGLGRAAGFRTLFERNDAFAMPDGERCKIAFASLPFIRWATSTVSLETHGEWFHDRLEELAGIPKHEEETVHNRMVGAAVLMFRARNSVKAAAFYNRWARFAGYPPIRLVSDHPTIIDMDQVVVQLAGDDMEVLKCRLA